MWLYVPSTSLKSAPVTQASSELSGLQAFLLARSVTSKTRLMRPQYWSRRWKREPWLRLLSGATSEPSTVEGGVESWISSLPDSPASHIRLQVPVLVQEILDGFGLTLPASSERPSPGELSSRTCPDFERLDLTGCSGTLPLSGTMLNGVISERQMLEPITDEDASSCSRFYPTPTVTAYGYCKGGRPSAPKTRRDSLETWAPKWPTATATDGEKGNVVYARGNPGLNKASKMWVAGEKLSSKSSESESTKWPTSTVKDAQSSTRSGPNTNPGTTLTAAVRGWATMTVRDSGPRMTDSSEKSRLGADAKRWATPQAYSAPNSNTPGQVRLDQNAKNWATATVRDSKDGQGDDSNMRSLLGRQAPMMMRDGGELSSSAQILLQLCLLAGKTPQDEPLKWRLNPNFVEWLMGQEEGSSTLMGRDQDNRVARLRLLGNGVVLLQVAHAIEQLAGRARGDDG